jgi:Ser/Thr protein kinase RdoA (MazF antagonist)
MLIVMKFTDSEIQEIARVHYNLDCQIKALNGYDEENYLLSSIDSKFILKVATEEHGFHLLDAQVAVSKHLRSKDKAYKIQAYLVNEKGEEITTLVKNDQKHFIRILSFLEGEFWVDKKDRKEELNQDLGSFVGKMDADLVGFQHTATLRYYEWDLRNTLDARRNLHHIKSHENRRIVSYFLLQFEMEVLPILHTLRSSVIHNDVNDYNVLREEMLLMV